MISTEDPNSGNRQKILARNLFPKEDLNSDNQKTSIGTLSLKEDPKPGSLQKMSIKNGRADVAVAIFLHQFSILSGIRSLIGLSATIIIVITATANVTEGTSQMMNMLTSNQSGLSDCLGWRLSRFLFLSLFVSPDLCHVKHWYK